MTFFDTYIGYKAYISTCLDHVYCQFLLYLLIAYTVEKSLGQHTWRCKKKLNNTCEPNEPEKTAVQLDSEPVSGCNIVKCVCGNECKGVNGLKMHQRRCRIVDNTESCQPPQFEYSNIHPREVYIERQHEEIAVESLNIVALKPGNKLPKSNEQWLKRIPTFVYYFHTSNYNQSPWMKLLTL